MKKTAGFISDEEMEQLDAKAPKMASVPGFISDEDMSAFESKDVPSELESGARGIAQGVTLGFADEITGGLESLFTDKSYQQARDESRANYQAAQDANPGKFLTGEIAGGVGSAFIPGLNIAKGAKLAQVAGKAALAGGLAGLGTSDADLTKGEVGEAMLDTATGTALGGGLGALGHGVAKAGGKLIEKAKPLAQSAKATLGKAATKLVEATSGIQDDVLETYVKNTDKVDDLIKTHGKEGLDDLADGFRGKWRKNIDLARQKINGQLQKAIEKAKPDQEFSLTKVRQALVDAKSTLDPRYNAPDIADIDEFLRTLPDGDGPLSALDMHKAKQWLQDQASGAYSKNGQIFKRGTQAARIAKQAAAAVRQDLNNALPEYADANLRLAKLHAIEKNMNKSLLAADKSSASIAGAGSGSNTRNARTLRRLGEATGTEMLDDAKLFAAAKTFSDPGYSALIPTGRSLLGAGLGYGMGGTEGLATGAALSSPAAIRTLLRSYRGAQKLGQAGLSRLPSVSMGKNPVPSFLGQLSGQVRPNHMQLSKLTGHDERKPTSEPISEEDAQQQFLEGNQ